MRVAFIVNEFPALSETFILNQITGLLDRGHEVDIYAFSPRNDPAVHADVERYNLLKHTYYLYASMPTAKVYRFIKGLPQIAINLYKKPLSALHAINVLKFGKDALSLRISYEITPFLDNGPYDIIHCQYGPLGNWALTLKAVGAIRGKIVTTFRGYDISSYIQGKNKHIYHKLFRNGDLFIGVSEQIKSTLIKLGCDEQKITVHRSGVQITDPKFRLRTPQKNGSLQLITIARLVEKKGVQYGIEAVAKILKKYPNLQYKIAGDGHLRKDLEKLIEELGLSKNIRLLGWQSKDEIRRLLQEADILLAPSVTSQNGDREGIPGAVVEALACGLPVISTQHSGIPEVVQDGESGLLVPERDADALAEKLDYLIEHAELWPAMSRKGRRYVEEHYDLEKLNDRLVMLYQKLLRDSC